MTIEQMKRKREEMGIELRKSIANTHAIEGAIQVLNELIDEEERVVKEPGAALEISTK